MKTLTGLVEKLKQGGAKTINKQKIIDIALTEYLERSGTLVPEREDSRYENIRIPSSDSEYYRDLEMILRSPYSNSAKNFLKGLTRLFRQAMKERSHHNE